jgi:alpha-galactosidase
MFEAIDEIDAQARVYVEGWQSWSPVGVFAATDDSPPVPDARIDRRPGKPVPEHGLQAEGLLAVELPEGGARAWYGADTPTLRVIDGVISTDGPVEEVSAESLDDVLEEVGDRLSPGPAVRVPAGWCSWYCHWLDVTENDIVAVAESDLPFEIVQIDDGWEAGIGDWLESSPRFGDVGRACERIRATGKRAGIWTAPFIVVEDSRLAHDHPDWLLADADAGWNWNQQLRVLDLSRSGAAEYLEQVFRELVGLGFDYFKLDFLYAGAYAGIDAYREGLRLIRRCVGPEATILGCGAPIFPSIGLVDAMRIGPDVLFLTNDSKLSDDSIGKAMRASSARQWMNGRLWRNDPDCLVVRPQVAEREEWASFVSTYDGVVFSSDRLADLDARGLELTRAAIGS